MTSAPDQLAILGAGSWGTALSIALTSKFSYIRLWPHDAQRAADMQECRENRAYLPGFKLPDNVVVCHDSEQALTHAGIVLIAVPSKHVRVVLNEARASIGKDVAVVSASKGLDIGTFQRMSQIISETLDTDSVSVLSGPTFAREVASGDPAAVVVAASDMGIAAHIQQAFATAALRLYASDDVIGVELGAALKNVIAIGAGICSGLRLGSNTVAALITRGLAEITRLAVAMGGKPKTLGGLAGLGDLVLTATGPLSRNRFVGLQLGEGRQLRQILSEMKMVAEGVSTCSAARQLALANGVDMPIISRMYEVLYEEKNPRQAIRELMYRPLTTE